jgi:uncharacterized spore protein YtfJ
MQRSRIAMVVPASVTPIAFIAIKGGEISFHGMKRGGALDALLEHLPEITEKILAKKQETEVQGKEEEPEAG